MLRALSKTGVPNLRAANAGDAEHEIMTDPVFTGRSQDGELIVELGAADREAILVQLANTKVRLAGDQNPLLGAGAVHHIRSVVIAVQKFCLLLSA